MNPVLAEFQNRGAYHWECLMSPTSCNTMAHGAVVVAEKVLVCVLAETRAHELTWESFKQNVLDELSADLAICVGVSKDYDQANPFYQHAKFHWTIPDFDDWGDAFDLAGHLMGSKKIWRLLLQVKKQWLGGIKGPGAHPGSAGILLFFRWLLQSKLVENGLLSRYDRVIVTRSDFYYWCPHPPLDIIERKYIWIPLGEDYGGFTDRHIVASSEDIVSCLDLIHDVLHRPRELYREMRSFSRWNLEMYIRYQFGKKKLEGRVRRFPYIMTAVRGEKDKTRWMAGEFDPAVGMIIKYKSEMQAANNYREIQSADDWRRLYETTSFQDLISPPDQFRPLVEGSWSEAFLKSAWVWAEVRLWSALNVCGLRRAARALWGRRA